MGAGDVRARTRCVLETIKGVLKAADGSLNDITFNQIFLAKMRDYAVMNEVYREILSRKPARAVLPREKYRIISFTNK